MIDALQQWIILVVGESELVSEKKFEGQAHTTLTEQAIESLQREKTQLRKYIFDGAFCSDLTTAQQTKTIVEDQLMVPVVTTDLLRERSYGTYEGKTYQSIQRKLGPRGFRLWDRSFADAPEGGESLLDVKGRLGMLINDIPNDKIRTTLFITHPDSAKALIWLGKPDMEEKLKKMDMRTTTIWSMWIR